jgi:hypothetical protein
LETLCLAAHACLSERAEELPDLDSCLLSINLRPQNSSQATPPDSLLKTPWSRMQVGAPAGQHLTDVDLDHSVMGYHA